MSDDTRRPEGQGVTGARLVSYYRGHLPGDGQRITAVHGDPVEVLGYVAPSRATAITGEHMCSGRKARGYGGESPESSSGEELLAGRLIESPVT